MNRGELRSRIRTELLEPTPARWTDNQLNDYLNFIQEDLADVSQTRLTASVNVTDGVAFFTSTIRIPESFWWIDGSRRTKITPAPIEVIPDTTTMGTPYYYLKDGSTITVFPKATGTILVRGIKQPTPMTDDAHSPEWVDYLVYEALIAGTVWQAYLSDGDPQTQVWEKKYLAKKADFAALELKRNPQRVFIQSDEETYPIDSVGYLLSRG